ncbi:ribonuclease YeeF family protein [Metabacillus sp. KIGAM252]|uniref:Ribonuclease YeeF family protein n=1 Tax=Metabacillus flavus TaxID=2823519 RepID=A0ABS5LJI3_9BACI|nr:T7SS effector LXG polymorphic toxin [Metabacillus flavus]MBS2970799.1 ribonuclease YeeF family protein [Metabacillus flavus]
MPNVYDSEALLTTMNERAEQYKNLAVQLQSLNEKFTAIIQDGEFQGKGAEAIKSFYQEHTVLVGKWVDFISMQLAFIGSIEGKMEDSSLAQKTFIREEFLEGELRNSIEKSRQMVEAQKEDLTRILSGINDILSLEVFSSKSFEVNIQKASKNSVKTTEDMHKVDIALTDDYAVSEMNQLLIKNFYTQLTGATKGAKGVNPMGFDAAAFRSGNVYKDLAQADRNALAFVEAKNKEFKAREIKELKSKLDVYKLSQDEYLQIAKQIGYKNLTEEQMSIVKRYESYKRDREIASGIKDGIYLAGKDFVVGIKDMVTKPQETFGAMGNSIIHPVDTYSIMSKAIEESWTRDVINGDANSRSRWISYALGTVGTSVVGTKGLGAAAKSGHAAKLGVLTKTGVKVTINKASDGFEKIRRINKNANFTPALELVPYNVYNSQAVKDAALLKIETLFKSSNKLVGVKDYIKDIELITKRKVPINQKEMLKKDFD